MLGITLFPRAGLIPLQLPLHAVSANANTRNITQSFHHMAVLTNINNQLRTAEQQELFMLLPGGANPALWKHISSFPCLLLKSFFASLSRFFFFKGGFKI